jgi:ethanolamine utilization protein EutP
MDRSSAFVLVGSIGAGKSTLFHALFDKLEPARKTQAVVFEGDQGVDTPGEFFSHPRMYSALIHTTSDVGTLVYVHDATDRAFRMPPGLLGVYRGKRVIAVITKTDLPGCDPDAVEAMLRQQGFAGKIYRVSQAQPDSIEALRRELLGDAPHLAAAGART